MEQEPHFVLTVSNSLAGYPNNHDFFFFGDFFLSYQKETFNTHTVQRQRHLAVAYQEKALKAERNLNENILE